MLVLLLAHPPQDPREAYPYLRRLDAALFDFEDRVEATDAPSRLDHQPEAFALAVEQIYDEVFDIEQHRPVEVTPQRMAPAVRKAVKAAGPLPPLGAHGEAA